jgi:redox-sensitive bicupin YhaK (pirin superfamily)
MITIRKPEEIHKAHGQIENGTFHGRWHLSFDQYYDPAFVQFGTLRVFNDDTLSPGAVWPLHPHREIEVVTYCAEGEFRHADQRGEGGVLKKGWVQHTTVGKGMYHSEINNRPDIPMRFIQMWFIPSERGLEPAVQQKRVERADRTNRFLSLVSDRDTEALPIRSQAEVYSSYLETDHDESFAPREGWGVYLYVVEGGPVDVNGQTVDTLGAAMVQEESELHVHSEMDAELLLVHVQLR